MNLSYHPCTKHLCVQALRLIIRSRRRKYGFDRLPLRVADGSGQVLHRENRLPAPGGVGAVNTVLVNGYVLSSLMALFLICAIQHLVTEMMVMALRYIVIIRVSDFLFCIYFYISAVPSRHY